MHDCAFGFADAECQASYTCKVCTGMYLHYIPLVVLQTIVKYKNYNVATMTANRKFKI